MRAPSHPASPTDMAPYLEDALIAAISKYHANANANARSSARGWKIILVVVLFAFGGIAGLLFHDRQSREALILELTGSVRQAQDNTLSKILTEVRSKPNPIASPPIADERLDFVLDTLTRQNEANALDYKKASQALRQTLESQQPDQTRKLLEQALTKIEDAKDDGTVQAELQRETLAALAELRAEIAEMRARDAVSTLRDQALTQALTQAPPQASPRSSTPTLAPTSQNNNPDTNTATSTNTDANTDASTNTTTDANTATDAPPNAPLTTAAAAAASPTRIVFIVDATDAMRDAMPGVLGLLRQTSAKLTPRHAVTILFYTNEHTVELAPYGVKVATPETRQALAAWLDPQNLPANPSGNTSPLNAINRAFRYQPDIIWLLTDRVDAAGPFIDHLAALNPSLPNTTKPRVRINTMQFYDRDPNQTLAAIAAQNGGRHQSVSTEALKRFAPKSSLR